VAYFSPEFGIAEALPQYSGGLGILAGDHLKSASDLGVPLVGVGLFYRHGYFRQALSAAGWQEERFPDQDPWAMALTLCDDIRVRVELAGTPLEARVWRADVGRVPLYLLDTDVEENPLELRGITDRLYGGDTEHRLRQEILLGIGGVRALRGAGHRQPQVFHTNEGHAGFLVARADPPAGPRASRSPRPWRRSAPGRRLHHAHPRAGRHRPVPPGADGAVLRGLGRGVRVTVRRPDDLGHRDDEPPTSLQHGRDGPAPRRALQRVSRAARRGQPRDVRRLWPDVPTDEVPIGAVTNGVHAATWVSTDIERSAVPHGRPDWGRCRGQLGPDRDGDDELTRVRDQARGPAGGPVASGSVAGLATGTTSSEARPGRRLLDPKALTIGFARRFATYKRATCCSPSPSACAGPAARRASGPCSSCSPARPTPPTSRQGHDPPHRAVRPPPDVRHRFVFVDRLRHGRGPHPVPRRDVWLNNPRRPLEACGTSGMKAALNGTLNCSILDGWWDECFDGENGWAIPSAEDEEPVGLGTTRTVQVTVTLGSLTAADVAVQLVHGTVGQGDELLGPEVTDLEPVEGSGTDGHAVYGGSILCTRPGRYGFTVRVAPTHPGLSTPLELGLLSWA
jgi:starch phosphorylase